MWSALTNQNFERPSLQRPAACWRIEADNGGHQAARSDVPAVYALAMRTRPRSQPAVRPGEIRGVQAASRTANPAEHGAPQRLRIQCGKSRKC